MKSAGLWRSLHMVPRKTKLWLHAGACTQSLDGLSVLDSSLQSSPSRKHQLSRARSCVKPVIYVHSTSKQWPLLQRCYIRRGSAFILVSAGNAKPLLLYCWAGEDVQFSNIDLIRVWSEHHIYPGRKLYHLFLEASGRQHIVHARLNHQSWQPIDLWTEEQDLQNCAFLICIHHSLPATAILSESAIHKSQLICLRGTCKLTTQT